MSDKREASGLQYVGDGTAWVIESKIVPTRDLTPEEVERFGGREELTRSGLYEAWPEPGSAKSESEVNDGSQ